MTAPSLLALASAANEAAIAYKAALDEGNYLRAAGNAILAGAELIKAVDALTGAVVEAENNRTVDAAAVAALLQLSGERDRLADEVVGLRETNQILLDRQATPGARRLDARRLDARRKVAARHLVEDGAVE